MVLPIASQAEQAGRPVQPSEPLSSLQLQACVQALEASGYAAADAPIAVMTYLTSRTLHKEILYNVQVF